MAASVRADLARLAALLPSLATRCLLACHVWIYELYLLPSEYFLLFLLRAPRYRATIAWDAETNRDVAFTLSLLGEVAEEASLQVRTFNLLNDMGEELGKGRSEGEQGSIDETVSETMSEEVARVRAEGEHIDALEELEPTMESAGEGCDANFVEGSKECVGLMEESDAMFPLGDESDDDIEVELMETVDPGTAVGMKRQDEAFRLLKEAGVRRMVDCEVCGKAICYRELGKHLRYKHGWETTNCPKCSKALYSLKFHRCRSKTCDQVGCEVCGQRVIKTFYTAHMEGVHGWGPSKFPKCSRCGHRMNRYTNHKCPLSKTKSTCPDCGAKMFYLATHLGSNVCKLRAAGNERKALRDVSPAVGGGGPPRTSESKLEPRSAGSGGKGMKEARRRKSGWKAKPAMVEPAPACEY